MLLFSILAHLDVGIRGAAHVQGGQLRALNRRHVQRLRVEVVVQLVLQLSQIFFGVAGLLLGLLALLWLFHVAHQTLLVVLKDINMECQIHEKIYILEKI